MAFKWTKERVQAAWLLGHTTMQQKDIAAAVNVNYETYRKWKLDPEFMAVVAQHEIDEMDDVRRLAYSRKSNRVKAINDNLVAIDTIYTKRGSDFTEEEDAKTGGKTGRIIRKKKALGSGEFMEVVTEYEVDSGSMRIQMELMKQLATELGQWDEETEEKKDTSIVVTFAERSDGPQ